MIFISISFQLCLGRSLSFEIPAGVGDDLFTVDSNRGIVTTRGTIDRETKDVYMIPIYVTESVASDFGSSFTYSKTNKNALTLFDVATLVIKINDVNDHVPEFRPGTCYPLAIPENHEAAIIHTVVATDLDEGLNGDITYTITGRIYSFAYHQVNKYPFHCRIAVDCIEIDTLNKSHALYSMFFCRLLQAGISEINSASTCTQVN